MPQSVMVVPQPPPRRAKWGLLLLVVGCLYATVIPSVSEYGAVLVANDSDLNRERRISSGASYDSDRATSLLRYGDAMNNRTLPRNPSGYQPSAEDDGSVIVNSSSIASKTKSNSTFTLFLPGRTINRNQNATIESHNNQRNRSASSLVVSSNNALAHEYLASDNPSVTAAIPLEVERNNTPLHSHRKSPLPGTTASSPPPPPRRPRNHTASTDIDLVSLTVRDDFFVLFNNSAISSWLRHIQNVRSVTFVGPPKDYGLFVENMRWHYPWLYLSNLHDDDSGSKSNNSNSNNDNQNFIGAINNHRSNNNLETIPIRWVNETHWKITYLNRYKCPYASVCQQLIKLHCFDLSTHLGLTYIGNNALVIDSDTVWGRDVTFVHPNRKVTYFDVRGTYQSPPGKGGGSGSGADGGDACTGMDPVRFTEGITAGSSRLGPRKPTLTPYASCVRPEHPNATGARHIVHHMLFQRDVMMELHSVVQRRWNVTTLWEAFGRCHSHNFCKSRIAEYELYFAFVLNRYPERVALEHLTNGVDYMGSSAVCGEEEMECCRRRGVILKGCHDHRIKLLEKDRFSVGDMCC